MGRRQNLGSGLRSEEINDELVLVLLIKEYPNREREGGSRSAQLTGRQE